MPKQKHLNPLPELAFGARRAKVDFTPQDMQDRVQRMTNWVTRQDALPHDAEFEYQSASIKLDGLQLIASASTPTTMQVHGPSASVVIPLHGQFTTRMGGKTFDYAATETALLMPKGLRDSEGGVKSSLIINFEEARLHQTIAAITGRDASEPPVITSTIPNCLSYAPATSNLTASFSASANSSTNSRARTLPWTPSASPTASIAASPSCSTSSTSSSPKPTPQQTASNASAPTSMTTCTKTSHSPN